MMDNWKSPIDLTMFTEEFATKMHDDQTGCIIEACMKMGINIDKEELLRALQYDRGQYEKGFADGIKARDEEYVRCKDCERNADNGGLYPDGRTRCPIQEHYALLLDGHCHLAKRREDDSVTK